VGDPFFVGLARRRQVGSGGFDELFDAKPRVGDGAFDAERRDRVLLQMRSSRP